MEEGVKGGWKVEGNRGIYICERKTAYRLYGIISIFIQREEREIERELYKNNRPKEWAKNSQMKEKKKKKMS